MAIADTMHYPVSRNKQYDTARCLEPSMQPYMQPRPVERGPFHPLCTAPIEAEFNNILGSPPRFEDYCSSGVLPRPKQFCSTIVSRSDGNHSRLREDTAALLKAQQAKPLSAYQDLYYGVPANLVTVRC